MNKPLVSIIICCHNRAHLLPETIASALAQKYVPVEIIVFDDGSTDNTAAVMEDYKHHIKYFRQENQGIAIARTQACKLAQGEYIAFLDDDDLMPPDRIDHLYEALLRFPAAVYATGDWELINESGNLTGKRSLVGQGTREAKGPRLVVESYEAVLWPRIPVAPHTTLFKRVDGESIGWFDPQFRYASEDKDFFARLAQLGPVVYVPKIVSYYRRGHNSLTANSIRTEYGALFLFRKHLQSLRPEHDALRRRLEARILIALKRMALYRSEGVALPEVIPADYLASWLPELNMVDRIKYRWYSMLKLPVRRLLRGRGR
jgi:glycosyltransferase involved in cell wall biosynthesis